MKFLWLLVLALSALLLIQSTLAEIDVKNEEDNSEDKVIENKLLNEIHTNYDNLSDDEEEEEEDIANNDDESESDNDREFEEELTEKDVQQFENEPKMQRLARELKAFHNFNLYNRNEALRQANEEYDMREALAEERAVRKRVRIRRRNTKNKVKRINPNKSSANRNKNSRKSNSNSAKRSNKNKKFKSKKSKTQRHRVSSPSRRRNVKRNGNRSNSHRGSSSRGNYNTKRGFSSKSGNSKRKSSSHKRQRSKKDKNKDDNNTRKSENDSMLAAVAGDDKKSSAHDAELNALHDREVADALEVIQN